MTASQHWSELLLGRVRRLLALAPTVVVLSSMLCLAPAASAQVLTITEGPDFGTVSVGFVDGFTLSAAGGAGPFEWSVVSGALPAGLSIRKDVPAAFPGTASAGLIGVATTPGTYSFTLHVTNGAQSGDKACTLTISSLVVKDFGRLPDAFVSHLSNYQLTALRDGVAVPASWIATSGLPDGMTVNAGGLLSGTPTTSGSYSIALQLTHDPGTGPQTVARNVNLSVFDVDITTPGTLPNATRGVPYSTFVTATGGAGAKTFSSPNLPSGLTLDPLSGQIAGTTFLIGPRVFSVTATDAASVSYTTGMSLDVLVPGPPPQLPRVVPYNVAFDDCTVGLPCSRGIMVTNGGKAPFTWAATGLPAGMGVRWGSGLTSPYINPGDAELWGSATVQGPYNVTVTVTDADGATASNTFPLRVSPMLVYGLGSLQPGSIEVPYSSKLRVIGGRSQPALSTPVQDETSWYTALQIGGQLPAGLSFDPATFIVSGTPHENGGFSALFLLTDADGNTLQTTNFVSIDGGGTSTIRVNGTGDLGTVTAGVAYSTQLSACCIAAPFAWSLVSEAPSPGASGLFLSANGLLSGTPNTPGTYTFLVRAADSTNPSNFGQRQFKLIVSPLSVTNPTGTTLPSGDVGTPYSQALKIQGGTAPNWTVAPFNYLPPGLSLDVDGTLHGTPTQTGQYVFTLNVSATTVPAGGTFVRTFTMFVFPSGSGASSLNLNGLPAAFTSGLGVVSSQISNAAVGGGIAPHHYSYTPGVSAIPGVRIQDGGPFPTSFAGTTVAGLLGVVESVGTYATSIRVTDAYGHVFDKAVTLTAGPLISPSTSPATLPKATVGDASYSFFLKPAGGSGPYLWTATGMPAGLILDPSTGEIYGNPTAPVTTSNNLVVTLKDSPTGIQRGQTLTLTVDAFKINQPDVLPAATIGTFYSQSFTSGCAGGCTWSQSGSLPGLSFNPATGVLSGMPGSLSATGATVVNGGSGYSVNDVLTISGGTQTTAATFKVTSVSAGGVVTGVSLVPSGGGFYTVLPSNPVSTTAAPAGGTSCTLNVSWNGTTPSTSNTAFTLTMTQAAPSAAVSKVFSLQVLSAAPLLLSISTGSSLTDQTVGNFTAQALTAVGGTPPYTWTLDSGALPAGFASPAPGWTIGPALTPGLWYLAGRGTQAGNYTFTLKVTDFAAQAATRTFSWAVSPLNRQYSSLPLSGGTLISGCGTGVPPSCAPYSQQLLDVGGTATGGLGNYTWLNTSPMPAGLSLNSATGVISGTPLDTGSVSVPIRVTDNVSHASILTNVSFTISPGTSTVSWTTSASLGTFSLGVAFQTSLNVTTSAINAGTLLPETITSVTLAPGSTLPPGMAILSGDALPANTSGFLLAGTPPAAGTFSFTLIAQDSAGNSRARTFTTTVAGFALAVPTVLADAVQGLAYSEALLTWDNTGSVVWSPNGTALPPGLALTAGCVGGTLPACIGGTPTTFISGTPTAAGAFSFSLAGTDPLDPSGAIRTQTFTLNVSAYNITDPQVLPDRAIFGVPFSYQFHQTGPTVAVWEASALPAPFGISPDGLLTGTTTSANGTFAISILLTNGLSGASRVVYLTRRFTFLAGSPNPSVLDYSPAAALLVDAVVGQSTFYQLLPSGGMPPYTWSLVVDPQHPLPPGMKLIPVPALGSTAPTTGNFIPGSTVLGGAPSVAGVYTFDLILTDSALPSASSVRRTFTLKVSPVAFLLAGNPRTAVVNVPYSQRFTPVGGTPPYTYNLSQVGLLQDMLPPGFALSDGVISGTTASTGNYIFLLTVEDSAVPVHHIFSRRYTLTVTNADGVFVSNSNPGGFWVGFGRRPVTLTVSSSNAGGLPPFTWSLAPGSLPLPAGVTIISGDPYTDANQTQLAGQGMVPGTSIFTLRATDPGTGHFADHTFTYQAYALQLVSPALELFPPNRLPSGHVGESYSTRFKLAGGTPPYIFSASPFSQPLPAGLTLDADALLHGAPTSIGNYQIAASVTDSAVPAHTGFIAGINLIVTAPGVPAPLNPTNDEFVSHASVGAPYAFALDQLMRGGVQPYSWALAPGSLPLPAGLTLLPGSNGLPTHLSGAASVAGDYQYSLVGSDSSGQSLTLQLEQFVSTLVLTPDSVPPGMVGAFYSQQLTPSGGVPPYTVAVAPVVDFPPGLTMSPSGLLQGIPTAPGTFPMVAVVTDSEVPTPRMIFKLMKVAIDNAAHESPAMTVAPKPIQVYYVSGAAAPGPVPISVGSTSGTLAFTTALAGIPGATLSSAGGTTPATVNLNLNINPASPPAVGTYVGFFGAAAPDASNIYDSVPVTLTVAPAPPCSWAVNPATGSQPPAGGNGSFSVNAGGGCAWTAVPNSPADAVWITVTANAAASGSNTVSYSVSANGAPTPRVGAINVHGQLYTITQFGSSCSFAIAPAILSATSAGGLAQVGVTASNSACSWGVDSGPNGLIVGAPAGPGDGFVTVNIPANLLTSKVQRFATIAGIPLVVNQEGTDCTVGLSPYEAFYSAAGSAGAVGVNVPSGCSYDTVAGPSWISVTSGGSGAEPDPPSPPEPLTLLYTIAPNPTTVQRTGTLTIGGQTFQITQAALACNITVDTSGLASPYGTGTGIVGAIGITANGNNCSWTASSGAAWASVSPASGTGTTAVQVSMVSSNAGSTTPRSTALTIAGDMTVFAVVPITQSGTVCSYNLTSASGSMPAAGGLGSAGVVAANACTWTAATNAPTWLSIVSAGAFGNGTVQFSAQPNPSAIGRTGTLTIATKTFTVTQAGAPCVYTVPAGAGVNAFAGSGTFSYSTAQTGCAPVPLSYAGWATIKPSSGFTGLSGHLDFAVAANPTTSTRTATIQIGDSAFTITQAAGTCSYSLSSFGAVFGQAGGTGNVVGSPNLDACVPDVSVDQTFIDPLGPLGPLVSHTLTLPYAVMPFSSLTGGVRVGRIMFGGQGYAVKQTSW